MFFDSFEHVIVIIIIVDIVSIIISCDLFNTNLYAKLLYDQALTLSPTSKSFDVWKDTSLLPPMFLKIYLFNWTNPEQLGIRGKKPHFDQLGPYCFR